MQQIYRETPMPKCDFNKVATPSELRHFAVTFFHCKNDRIKKELYAHDRNKGVQKNKNQN